MFRVKSKLIFTTHALRRMLRDTPLPSYLMLGIGAARVLHVVAGDDPEADETIVITTYEPDPNEWEADFKTRKKRP